MRIDAASLASVGTQPIQPADRKAGATFGDMLASALGETNRLAHRADDLVTRFAAGEPLDVHQVTIAMEEASTALALTLQVRNKLVEAYQEIMRISV
ncbi:MAG: flagellar hook-basal body complex protein FliE [Chthonomonadales bacterium]